MLNPIFFQISILLGITFFIALIVRLLRQPLIVGYLITGIIVGPFMLNIFRGDTGMLEAFSQFGVVLLLFVVGLSLNFDHIKKIGKISLFAGLAQIFFTALIGTLLLKLLDFSLFSAICLAVAITFSSTIIIVKLLSDKKDLETVYGRYTVGLMIVQDIVAIVLMIVLSSFSLETSLGRFFIEMFTKIVLLSALVVFLSRYIIPKALDNIAKSGEFLFLFTLAWCFGIAAFLYWFGFTLEVGALIAGLSLGSSPYQSEISSRIKPLRDFFIVIFFIILGSQFIVSDFQGIIIPSLLLSLFILIGNPLVLYFSFRFFKFTRRNSFLAGVTAAQVSEFGFVVLLTGRQLGYISGNELSIFTLVALITIILSTYLITHNEGIYRFLIPFFKLFGADKNRQQEYKIKYYDVWLFGHHRIGWKITQMLKEEKKKFAVVDFNPEIIQKIKREAINAYFGDAADVEFLDGLSLEKSKLIISTIPDVDDQRTLMKHMQTAGAKAKMIMTAHSLRDAEDLYANGADFVMIPHLLGGSWMAKILSEKAWSKKTFEILKKEQKIEIRMKPKTA